MSSERASPRAGGLDVDGDERRHRRISPEPFRTLQFANKMYYRNLRHHEVASKNGGGHSRCMGEGL